jgi:hypothetical protein
VRLRLFASGPFVALAAALTLAACGGSNATSSTGGGGGGAGSASTPTSVTVGGGGGSFCDQTVQIIAQLSQLGKSFIPSPGATPNVASYKQLLGTVAAAIDALDSSAPGEIATDFHTFRAAYDQANTQVQSATTFTEISAAFASLNTPAVKAAGDHINTYLRTTCGINPSATP